MGGESLKARQIGKRKVRDYKSEEKKRREKEKKGNASLKEGRKRGSGRPCVLISEAFKIEKEKGENGKEATEDIVKITKAFYNVRLSGRNIGLRGPFFRGLSQKCW